MKNLLAIQIAFIFFITSISPAFAQKTSSCENGECIAGIITKLENLSLIYRKNCLPPEIKESEIMAFHEKNGFTEACWKNITDIQHNEELLAFHQNKLEAKLGCTNGDCKNLTSPGEDLSSQLKDITKTQQENTCSPQKKLAVNRQCPADMNCALMASAIGVSGYLAELVVPKNSKPNDCHLGNDSCTTQLATGFLKAAFTFFEGAWDILKLAGKKAGGAISGFWNWVSDAEDHTSTSQLAMAKASEDKGVFDMLVNDFPGTMKNIWQALVASLKEWIMSDMLCQKWSGIPHFSNCLKPTQNIECLPCKTMMNGLCAISGAVTAEIIPAFFSGGLSTAAKYGAKGAGKIAKLFKVSSSTAKSFKASKLGKAALISLEKSDDILKISKILKATKTAIQAAQAAIRIYMLSPARKVMKVSFSSLANLTKKGSAYLAVTPTGKVLIFSNKVLKSTVKVVLYPIENPMTATAYKTGQRSFEQIFKLGNPKLVTSTLTVSHKVIQSSPALENILANLEIARVAQKPQVAHISKMELEAYHQLVPVRKNLAANFLSEHEDLDDVIKTLYPELQYSSVARSIGAEKIIEAEKELWEQISLLPEGAIKSSLINKYHARVSKNSLRKDFITERVVTTTPEKIIENSKLSPQERFNEAILVIKRTPSHKTEATKLSQALERAHLSGANEVFEYSWRELREKYRILTEGGFTPSEADELLRLGLAGRPPVRELIQPGETLFSGFAEDILEADYLKRRSELQKILNSKTPKEASAISDSLESLYFIDYEHSAYDLNQILQGKKTVSEAKLTSIYNDTAFKNFKETRNWLLKEMPELNKETLLGIHKRILKDGVADFGSVADLGRLRSAGIKGNVPPGDPITAEIIKEIEANPYLTWVEWGQDLKGRSHGKILYPNPKTVKAETLTIISKKHPELASDLKKYKELTSTLEAKQQSIYHKRFSDEERIKLDEEIKILQQEHNKLAKNEFTLTQKLVDALVDDLMEWFTRQRALIGEINSPEKLDDYISLLADFQKRLVSIHPLTDGNGRSSREFISYALMKEGFPPPRIIETNADLYTSTEEWKLIIKQGILSSDYLMDDILERAKFGLPIENSMELITPYSRPAVKLELKGVKNVPTMDGVEYIDPRFYREMVRRMMKADPDLEYELSASSVKAWEKINKKAEDIFSKNNIYYNHPKKGIERLEIGYVDEDFKKLFGQSSFDNQELFNFKMKTWYSDEINWRGLASRYNEKTEVEIIEMFKDLNFHLSSNSVLGKMNTLSTPDAIKKAALLDFDKLNDDIFGDGLVAMARDHSETGPMYNSSYGYSTSKSREVGKAFAMGAMVVGKYGEHKLPELQELLKSRVLVGAKKSVKDVDLGRLKQLRPEFSYKYGRQQEVMGVGASDPDAVTIIQTIDAKGEVINTYLRNAEKPDEIWVIKGDINPDAKPSKEQLIRTIKLRR